MRVKRWTAALAAVGLLLVVSACGDTEEGSEGGEPASSSGDEESGESASDAYSGPLTFATFTLGGSWYVYGGIMSTVINESTGYVVTPIPRAGGIGNAELVSRGDADLGLGFTMSSGWATEGDPPYEESIENIRSLGGGFDLYYILPVVPAGSSLTSLEQIVDEELAIDLVTLGPNSTGEIAARHILEAMGIDYDTLEEWGGSYTATSPPDVVNRFSDGRADLFIHVGPLGHPTYTELATGGGIDFLPVDGEVAEYLLDVRGWSSAETMPGGSFTGQDDDLTTVGFNTNILVNEDMPDDLAYELIEALSDNTERLVEGAASLSIYDPETAWQPENAGAIPLHPGAEQFYRDRGYMD